MPDRVNENHKRIKCLWPLDVGLWSLCFGLCALFEFFGTSSSTKYKDQRPKTEDQNEKVRQVFPVAPLTALLLAHLFVGGDPFEAHAAVCCRRFHSGAARSEIERNLLRDFALNSHRKIYVNTSIHCSRLEIRRIILRD